MSYTLNSLIQFVRNNPESVSQTVGARILTRALNSHYEWPLRDPLPNVDHAWIYRVMNGSQPLFELFHKQNDSAKKLTAIGANGHDNLDLRGLLDALFAGNPPAHLLTTEEPERFTYNLRTALMEQERLALSTSVRFVGPR
ncbi:MAG: hypothetical protein KAZ30_01900 [Candidatus Magasanikbacteria bacterium]|nr:hypothetical protein [Candidatus Magasanikbacteria bacterium]